MRARLALLLIALLPGLGLAGVGGMRVCLAALVGGADCCPPQPEAGDCCACPESAASGPLAPQGLCGAEDDRCTLCCVELEGSEPIAEGASRGHGQVALAPVPMETAPFVALDAARAGPIPPRAPRPPPDAATNLPLRI